MNASFSPEEGAPRTLALTWKISDEPYPDLEVNSGDIIFFDYTRNHNVRMFKNEEAYEDCDFDDRWISPEGELDAGPISFVVAEEEGETIYVGCSVDDHCENGNMKLVINVV